MVRAWTRYTAGAAYEQSNYGQSNYGQRHTATPAREGAALTPEAGPEGAFGGGPLVSDHPSKRSADG